MSGRLPAVEDGATIRARLAEIQAERMAAIAGCSCQARDVAGRTVHTPLCPLRPEPAAQLALAREAIQRARERQRARLAQPELPIERAIAHVERAIAVAEACVEHIERAIADKHARHRVLS
jgi:hypothetical protein